MTQHGTGVGETHGRNVRADGTTDKSKRDSGIRVRKWKGSDGAPRTAYQADAGMINGKRVMRSFTTKAEAKSWLHEMGLVIKDQGQAAMSLSDRERLDAIRAGEALKEADLPDTIEDAVKCFVAAKALLAGKTTILDAIRCYGATTTILEGTATPEVAARYYREHKAPVTRRSVAQVVDEHIADAKDRNVRPITLRDLDHRLGLFKGMFGDRLITEITKEDAEQWIRSRGEISSITKKNYRVLGGGLFNFAIEKEYVTENPFARRTRRRHHEDEKLPECLSWQDVTALLKAAAAHEPSMVAPLAIGCFCGLRTAELRGMDWKHVNLADNRITVDSSVAKKRRTRYVVIPANLAAWLLPHRETSGFVAPQGQKWRFRFDHVREMAKIRWPSNAMRHAFASHHLAMYGDPARTAFELGHHRDTSMLFDHYRALITKEDAESYWKIMPTEVPGVVQLTVSA